MSTYKSCLEYHSWVKIALILTRKSQLSWFLLVSHNCLDSNSWVTIVLILTRESIVLILTRESQLSWFALVRPNCLDLTREPQLSWFYITRESQLSVYPYSWVTIVYNTYLWARGHFWMSADIICLYYDPFFRKSYTHWPCFLLQCTHNDPIFFKTFGVKYQFFARFARI